MSTRLICPLISAEAGEMSRGMALAKKCGADTVECRLDFLARKGDESELRSLLDETPLPTIATNRPVRQGGKFDGDESQRLETLCRAADFSPDFIDVENDVPLKNQPEAPIILSYHDFQSVPSDLDSIVAEMDASPAAVNKIVFTASGPEDAFRAFDVLRSCRKPTIALAMGQAGVISRILAGKFGAFGTFASLEESMESAAGQPTIEQFKTLYRWDEQNPRTQVFGVIGCPVGHSMSPAIHNAAFSATGIDAVYVPLLIQPGEEKFNRFMDELLARPWMDFRGLSVTIPHKENALAYVGEENCDELAVKIGAINTITLSPQGDLRGDNTDYAAAIDALCAAMNIERKELSGRVVAILGAGGVARAIVAALKYYGAEVTIYNRTVSRAEKLAEEFDAKSAGLYSPEKLDAEIVINCTSVGMYPNVNVSPLESIPPCVKVVFDTIYNPIETKLLSDARAAGCKTISGLDMFVNQAVAQFEIWTETKAPREIMKQIVIQKLQK